MGRRASLALLFAALCPAQSTTDFTGTWVAKAGKLPVMKLTLAGRGESVTGTLTMPESISSMPDGDIATIGGQQETSPIGKCRLNQGRLELDVEGAAFEMSLVTSGVAAFGVHGLPQIRLERVPTGTKVVVAKTIPEPKYSREIRDLRARLKEMVKADQDGRMTYDEARWSAADGRNRSEVLRIFAKYGWPKASLIGRDAAHDFWLLVQHQTVEIMRRLLAEMEKATREGEASRSDYALLYDRVQVSMGKPQHWGNSTHCVDGRPVLDPVDDPAGLAQRRKELFQLPVEEYLKADYMVKSCAK